MKICRNCKEEKLLKEFGKRKSSRDGLHYECKTCITNNTFLNKEKRQIYNVNNHDKIKQYRDKNYIENFKHVSKLRSKWNKNNRDKIRKYENIQMKTNPHFKISKLLRSGLYRTLKSQNAHKLNKTLILLGCTIIEFKQHLEQQFKPEMNWLNHGTVWEIDHIKACSKFDLTDPEQQKQCFHYTNMQPLFTTTIIAESLGYIGYIGNREKSNK
jgi:hypothetical protein